MKNIPIVISIISASVILTACQSSKPVTDNAPTTTQQPVRTETQQKLVTYQSSRSNLSFQHPQEYKISQANISGDTTDAVNIETTNKDIKENFRVELRSKQPPNPELEFLNSDNYRGKEITANGIKYTCFERMNAYIKDTYKQRGQAYVGQTPNTGYRVDCYGRRRDGSFIYIFYQNNTDDRFILRDIQATITKIRDTAQ